jgi:hypothetical protein
MKNKHTVTDAGVARLVAEADAVNRVTPAEAAALPGILGRLVPAMLAAKGWYGCTISGKKTLYLPVSK